MAWLKNGEQTCPRCRGDGCYQCHKSGTIVLCPGCANREPYLLTKVGDDIYSCSVCQALFSRSGALESFQEEEQKKKKWDPSLGKPPK